MEIQLARFGKRLWLAAFLALVVAFFVSPLRGQVCISQLRFSNDNEQVNAGLGDYIRYLRQGEFQDPVPPHKIRRKTEPPFTTVENLKSRFPSCCRVISFSDSDYGKPSWYEWLSGEVGSHVRIVVDVPYFGDGGEQLSVRQMQIIPVSTCGTIATDQFYTPIGGM
jgi:hypothetical protein